MFNGSLHVTVGTRSGAVEDLVRRAVTESLRERNISSETEVFAMLRQLTMAASLRQYKTPEITVDYPELPMGSPKEFRDAAEAILAKIPAYIQNLLKPRVTDFHALVDALSAKAQDASFWEGTPA